MFKITRKGESFNINFSATLENVDRAGTETRHFLISIGKKKCVFEVLLLMREALNNAVQKGCNLDCEKNIRYSIKLDSQTLIMQVEDDGDGFDWKACMEKERTSKLDHGRGLQIMKNYSDEIKYNDKGNALEIRKHLIDCNTI